MPRRAKLWPLAWLLGVAAFVAVLGHLFQLRFESGELYPPYSSFRADPIGCRALYESLDGLGGLTVSRNLDPLPALGQPRGRTLCVFGVTPPQLWVSPAEARELDAFLRGGGRLVMTFLPHTWAPKSAAASTNAPLETKKNTERRFVGNLAENWGVKFHLVPLPENEETARAFACHTSLKLPRSISWHSTLVFTNLNPAWKTIYARDNSPVLIERPLGKGTLVFAADTYFASNEALLKERHPALLAWLIGPAAHVIFDETHLGVAEEPGIAGLLRNYRLHGLLAALLALAALFVWRQSVPFLPAAAESGDDGTHVAGRTAAAGFVNLLRRSIPPKKLPDVCLDEWEKSFLRSPQYHADRVARARELAQGQDPVVAYHAIRQLFSERKQP
ncbi:MAG: DUF4350 domain-containing protein [Verrucomicrobia bacterium]|nr:DUF4350 domain-containing protein [Verrucomicrobiota bacterium]